MKPAIIIDLSDVRASRDRFVVVTADKVVMTINTNTAISADELKAKLFPLKAGVVKLNDLQVSFAHAWPNSLISTLSSAITAGHYKPDEWVPLCRHADLVFAVNNLSDIDELIGRIEPHQHCA
jgi:hypothetical protein